ncbi:MAG: hypothetical protein MRZ98_05290, partial [Clostridiales bacterium]|nr:hypothetical protein [Clostridiales bacterium]
RADFNSRPRTGGDQFRLLNQGQRSLFQFTPPHGGRPENCTFLSKPFWEGSPKCWLAFYAKWKVHKAI